MAGALSVALAAGFLAGHATLSAPPQSQQVPGSAITVEVTEGEVGRVLTLSTSVTRPQRPLAVNTLPGVVNGVGAMQNVGAGQVLYRVDDVPVAAAPGTSPFWRNLGPGARGEDVRQVQEMLRARGEDLSLDGVWNRALSDAVSRWQREVGAQPTGRIDLGHLVAVGDLPASLAFDAAVLWPGRNSRVGRPSCPERAGNPSSR